MVWGGFGWRLDGGCYNERNGGCDGTGRHSVAPSATCEMDIVSKGNVAATKSAGEPPLPRYYNRPYICGI